MAKILQIVFVTYNYREGANDKQTREEEENIYRTKELIFKNGERRKWF